MGSIRLIFVDGWGIGADSRVSNPYFHASTPFFDQMTNGYGMKLPFPVTVDDSWAVIPTDACLGIQGLPQSATGQTALMTGLNAPLLMGRHISGYPTRMLQQIISATNIMQISVESGFSTFLVNAYSPEYFEVIATGKRKHAAIALTALAAGIPFCSLEDLTHQQSIYQDITNQLLLERGHPVPILDPKYAGVIFAEVTAKYDFSVFEYFQSDVIGHKKDMVASVRILETLDSFFAGIMSALNLDEDVVIIASDHGNMEDVTTGTHTRNPVPTILLGRAAVKYADSVKDITDISYLIRMIQNNL